MLHRDRSRWALLVIDMQRDFCAHGGYAERSGINVSRMRAPIVPIRALLDEARHYQLRIVHTREGHRRDLSDLHPAKRRRSERAGGAIGSLGPMGRLLVRGDYGHDIIDELSPLPGEPVVDKPGYGAFYQTDLEQILRAAGIAKIVLTGITTDVCVHSTLREAVDRGFECITVSDATAAADPTVQAAMLACIAGEGGIFGEVMTSAGVIAMWRGLFGEVPEVAP